VLRYMSDSSSLKPVLLFIGSVNYGKDPLGGEEFKNRLLLPMLRRYFRVILLDTAHWRNTPRTWFRMLWYSFLQPLPNRILISASSESTYRLLRLWHLRKALLERSVYLVVGGYFPGAVASGRFRAEVYRRLASILVQGSSLQTDLAKNGLSRNVGVVSNFKPMVPAFGDSGRFNEIPPLRCVVLTRISKDKGIPYLFQAMELLGDAPIQIDLFGPIDDAFRREFNTSLLKDSRFQYQGYLDLLNHPEESYKKLSTYHVLLFPTQWVGEGFPGVVLDAYLAGLPVIATDWNMNSEVVIPGETGWLISPGNPQALADAMMTAVSSPPKLAEFSKNSREKASLYDVKRIFIEKLLPILFPDAMATSCEMNG